MSKIIDATCADNKVTADGVVVDVATILSKGKGSSQGILIIEEGKAWFIPNRFSDLDSTLENVIAALDKAVTALQKAATSINVLDNHGFLISADNGVPATPSLTSEIDSINSAASDIGDSKAALETLKGDLK